VADAQEIAAWLDGLLRISEIPDYPGAVNGLQLASRGEVHRVACAVDYSSVTVTKAVQAQSDMLLVHHGMFWNGVQALRGPTYERIAALIEHDIAIYSSHLPLDLHPEIGNNVLLAHRLALTPNAGFARFKTTHVGVSGDSDVATSQIIDGAAALAREYGGSAVSTPHDPDRRTRRWGICTGAGADNDTIREAIERGIDTMIVGEGPHHTAVTARDHGIVVVYAGHYATETLGVRALADRVSEQFAIQSLFLDVPTGL
jgi:dinuclear metal center YbgI/SA1388 family protein